MIGRDPPAGRRCRAVAALTTSHASRCDPRIAILVGLILFLPIRLGSFFAQLIALVAL